MLTDPARAARIREGLARVRARLGGPGASRRAAEAILEVYDTDPTFSPRLCLGVRGGSGARHGRRPGGSRRAVARRAHDRARPRRRARRAVDRRSPADRDDRHARGRELSERYVRSALQFRVPGGQLGRYRSIVVGAPEFVVGQRVVVFLGARGPAVPFVLGLSQGVFRIVSSAGGWIVTPPPMLPAAGGRAGLVRGDPARRPLPLADFEQHVRALAGVGR